jgi:hypothetical protein
MQSFNFFLVATAFLVAAYATVLKERAEVATVAAILGAWIAMWFNRLERRTKQLVRPGKRHSRRPSSAWLRWPATRI